MNDGSIFHTFGIRHHGPGSARSLLDALLKLEPDCILIEGPPEGDSLMPLVVHEEMKPPVAMLVYSPDDPTAAVFYPFAIFSPEWQAITYAKSKNVPVKFIDLPQSHWLAISKNKRRKLEETNESPTQPAESESEPNETEADGKAPNEDHEQSSLRQDPLSWLARAAGYKDGERWWEHMVEQRQSSVDLFQAINEAMTSLRNEVGDGEEDQEIDHLREAQMRQQMRAAEKGGYKTIAVVCGAWHTPALRDLSKAKDDVAALKGLPKVKVEATWIPWTHGRLSYTTGYGAGVRSPGWYHHLWTSPDSVAERWMAHVAQLLRSEGIDASSASVIEAVRLADALSSIRERPLPSLTELSEAIRAVLCFGRETPMRIIHNKLIVGEILGAVPEVTPTVPLQEDLQAQQKRFRLPPAADEKIYDLDLRREIDLDRSRLLHRLRLLGINWGQPEKVSGKSGTFHEIWRVRWQPEFSLRLIERGVWGRTIKEAGTSFACDAAEKATELPTLSKVMEQSLLADLQTATEFVLTKLQTLSAIASDVKHLMMALPSLAQTARYGDVRKTDVSVVLTVISGLVSRICIGMPGGCASLDDEAAEEMHQLISKAHSSIMLLEKEEFLSAWVESLNRLAESASTHGLVCGRAARLLLDLKQLNSDEIERRFSLALSTANDPKQAACWAEGFLKGSGLLLIHNQTLWFVVDQWLTGLSDDVFIQVLPMMKRTFSTFTKPERRQMGELVRRGRSGSASSKSGDSELNLERAQRVLPILYQIFGIKDTADLTEETNR